MAENDTHDCGLTLNTYCMVCDTAGLPLREYVESLKALLRESKREHTHCDDSWYCCGRCQHPDHILNENEFLDSHTDEGARTSGVCNCAADAWNIRVDEALAE